jgi:hypothetical protein
MMDGQEKDDDSLAAGSEIRFEALIFEKLLFTTR